MEPLNVVIIQIDSLNRHFLRCYGNDWVQTPNLDAFAERAAVFEQHFVGSLPCMPARREIWTGTEEFWWRGWGPLEPWDLPLAHIVRQSARPITTQLVTDHYHFFEWGSHSFFFDFHGYDFIRGHEMDNWRTDPLAAMPDWAEQMMARRPPESRVYLQNVQDFQSEADFFGPRVMQTAAEWLDRNHNLPQFYLHVDSFDVHEPFHIPEPYRSMYSDDDYRRYSPWPHYGRIDEGMSALPEAEVAWVRAQFAGKLTMVDHWLGHLFERLERYKLWDRTCVIITTDHGHYLGDHGWMGKPHSPMYHTLCHIPLLVWHPALRSGRIDTITQTKDLYATILELLGVAIPEAPFVHSRSFAPVLRGDRTNHRDYAVYGYNNKRIGITAGEWTLLRFHETEAAWPVIYTHNVQQGLGFGMGQRDKRPREISRIAAGQFIPGVEMPVWRVPLPADHATRQPTPRDDLLFHNPSDPAQERDVAAEQPEALNRLHSILSEHAAAIGAPEEQMRRLRLE